jgi:cytochrome c1
MRSQLDLDDDALRDLVAFIVSLNQPAPTSAPPR